MALGYSVFTSNVDGQFQKAGFDQDAIHERHGSIHHLQCLKPCCDAIWPADDFAPEVDAEQCLLLNTLPTCPHCGGMARPNVMMFNDWEWLEQRQIQQAARMENWLSSMSRPVVVEIGANTAIPSVRHFSHRIIHEFGGRLVRINPREFGVPMSFDIGLPAGAAHALAEIDSVMRRTHEVLN
jgi:NAD-dependent SIR2 family protein deacetylase